jgi:ABC-type antimicrobial peptide transport system permease subunit
VTAFSVSVRTREIGIRAVLGARPSENFGVVLADVLKPLAAGLTAGALLSLAGAPALSTLLFGVSPIAPATTTLVSLLLFAIGLGAATIGAWRLKSIDPIIALRAE